MIFYINYGRLEITTTQVFIYRYWQYLTSLYMCEFYLNCAALYETVHKHAVVGFSWLMHIFKPASQQRFRYRWCSWHDDVPEHNVASTTDHRPLVVHWHGDWVVVPVVNWPKVMNAFVGSAMVLSLRRCHFRYNYCMNALVKLLRQLYWTVGLGVGFSPKNWSRVNPEMWERIQAIKFGL